MSNWALSISFFFFAFWLVYGVITFIEDVRDPDFYYPDVPWEVKVVYGPIIWIGVFLFNVYHRLWR